MVSSFESYFILASDMEFAWRQRQNVQERVQYVEDHKSPTSIWGRIIYKQYTTYSKQSLIKKLMLKKLMADEVVFEVKSKVATMEARDQWWHYISITMKVKYKVPKQK